ncbi:MAG TPA: hypothetical protein DCP37_03295 [Dehalococcoidia bacterium]|nr:hypothetical protein [SAR202 cluster bacterium]HAL46756.1 hypothetical protein [Dehalococcoidia bacterium]|tara:strand:- start:493 stop:792 length:300 start_codon:yes stop_codon:yes gene_type:complete
MAPETNRLITLDPRDAAVDGGMLLAPRTANLDGAVIGLLSNNNPNSEELMRMIVDMLKEKYAIAGAVEANKGTNRWPAPTEIIEDLADRCDVTIHATAD